MNQNAKCRQKPFSDVWGWLLWQIPGQLYAIPDNKLLANRAVKIRFNAVCWSNRYYYVTCGCHLNAVSYFVLWYFLIGPTSSRHLCSADAGVIKQAPVSALFLHVQSFCFSQRLWAKRSVFRSTFSDRSVFCANTEIWLRFQKKCRKSGNHNCVKALFKKGPLSVKTLALVPLLSVTPLDIGVFASTVYI